MRILFRGVWFALCTALPLAAVAQVGSGSVSYNGGASQDFDLLESSGTSALLPEGWYFRETAGPTTASYQADDGSISGVGDVMSYGSTGSSDRAFGSLATNALTGGSGTAGQVAAMIGVKLQNTTGSTLSSLQVSYVGEVWLVQVAAVDKLGLEFSTDATAINTGTWTPVTALDFATPAALGTGKKNGNLPANRTAISGTINGLSVANGAYLWVRWTDTNISNNDNGLAIDDIVFGTPVDNPPALLPTSTPTSGQNDVPVTQIIELEFSESVSTASPNDWYALDCAGPIAATAAGSGDTRTITPDAPLPFSTACTLTLTAADITDGSNQILAGTNTLSFNTAEDMAPTVQTITPAHASNGVAVNANIVFGFSEPVTVIDPWVALSCVPSGLHAGTITGAGSSYQFDPSTNFTPGDACTVTLDPANVRDQDGTVQTLSGQNAFTFDVAPDNAPTIVSTFPADNAVNVSAGSTLTVTFSEPVNIASPTAAFQIACGATPHPFSISDTAQTTYSLDPNDDFAANTACTLTIVANEIFDIDGSPNALVDGAVVDFTTSAGVSGYYERVDTSSCRALRATLHGVIDDHNSVSYKPVSGPNNDTWDLLEPADVDPLDPTKILDVYENKKYDRVTDRASTICTGRYNREHTWPKSLGFPSETGDQGLPNAPHTDGHMLYLSNCPYNSNRGNNPYRNCANPGSCNTDPTQLNHGEGGPGINNLYTGSFYDVWPKRRGDVARAVMYMDFRYEGGTNSITNQSEPDLVLTYGADGGTPGSLDTLLAWHNADPPSNPNSTAPLDNIEVLRNDTIQLIQRNRNPLIDHPEWATILFANPCLGPAVVAVDDDFTTPQDTTLTRGEPGVLRDDHNGVSKNGQGLSATLLVQAQHGTATITNSATGAFTYVPNAGFSGEDSFTYTATNGSASDQGVVHIVVGTAAPDAPPTASADSITVNEDSGATVINVLTNDSDPDGGPKFVQATTQPVGGSVSIGAGGTNVSFTPSTNICGATSFSYTLNGGSSAVVSVTVTCQNDAPNAVGTLANQTYPVGTNVSLATASGFDDIDNDVLSYSALGLPASLSIHAGTGVISGTLQAGDVAPPYAVIVTAKDPSNAEVTQQFSLTVTPLPDDVFEDGFETAP